MNDYISRQAAIDAIESHIRVGDELYPLTHDDRVNNWGFEVSASCVYNLPSADVKKIEHGYWINHTSELFPADGTVECSVCHEHESVLLAHDNYCPNCGAKMDEVK